MKISLSHGNGGAETAVLIRDYFQKWIHSPALARQEDAALLAGAGRLAFTADAFVVRPLFFPGGDIGKLAVCGTVNDLLAVGAKPKYLSLSFVLEENLDTDDLERILRSIAGAAREARVAVVAADTKVIEGNGGLTIGASGIGFVEKPVRANGAKQGDAILVSGNLGDHHACILSARMNIANDIRSDCAPLHSLTAALARAGVKAHAMRDITRGGLATVMNEIAQSSGLKAVLREKDIPVSREVRGLCDILGLDPLVMGNEGKLLAVVPAGQAQAAAAAMRRTKYGGNARIIGHMEAGGGVILETLVGGARAVRPLRGEGLPRIC